MIINEVVNVQQDIKDLDYEGLKEYVQSYFYFQLDSKDGVKEILSEDIICLMETGYFKKLYLQWRFPNEDNFWFLNCMILSLIEGPLISLCGEKVPWDYIGWGYESLFKSLRPVR